MKLHWVLYHMLARWYFDAALRQIRPCRRAVRFIVLRRLHHVDRLKVHGWD